MSAGHTPGPWFADGSGNIRTGPHYSDPCIATANDPHHGMSYTKINAANARLIAAAPRMYEFVKAMAATGSCPEAEAILKSL